MKTKNLLLTGLIGLGMLTACSNEDELGGQTGKPEGEKAYAQIAINIAGSNGTPTTRTETSGNNGDEQAATDVENHITDITVVLADANGIAQQVVLTNLKTEGSNKTKRATEPFEVPAGKYYVYVLANYNSAKTGLTPVIVGQTDMKQTFGITDASKLSSNNNFFMTNAEQPTETDLTGTASGTEVDDDGTTETGGETLHLIQVNIERVVSKVTFNNTDEETFEVKDENSNKIATATLKAVSLINLNKKMFLVKEKEAESFGPTTKPWTSWYYVKDPNYSTAITTADDILANFSQTEAKDESFSTTPCTVAFYCPENTIGTGNLQQNGQTTGVVYKVEYKPETGHYTAPSNEESASDMYSQLFKKVLSYQNKNNKITANIFNDNLETGDGAPDTSSFYEYKGRIFKNKNAAYLFCAMDKNTDDIDGSKINTAFTGYFTNAPEEVHLYEAGICYYTAWIKHNPDGGNMEAGKYGTVRNHWYELKVKSISSLGYYKPTYEDPEDPDDPAKAKIQVLGIIKQWILVKQDVIL